MKKIIFVVATVFIAAMSFAQGEIDAYRFSTTDLQGSARGQAMGGAFGALGGDITGVAINPAGIGIYRSSELVANIGTAYFSNNTKWNGDKNSGNSFNLNFQNVAYTGYYQISNTSAVNFGFNFNRLKTFDNKYRICRNDMKQSLTDYMAYTTNGTPSSVWDYYLTSGGMRDQAIYSDNIPWLSILAWDGGLLRNDPSGSDSYKTILAEGELVAPNLYVEEKGHINAYDFTVGQNISNSFYWGVSVSITDVDYSMYSDYEENFLGSGSFHLENSLITKGSGFQIKAGVLFRPINELRIGLSYHSPIWFTLSDYYQASLTPHGIYIDNALAQSVSTPGDARTDYNISTPSTVTLSAALIMGKNFILSSDLEYKGYQYMSLQDPYGRSYEEDNAFIDEDFGGCLSWRVGAETKITPRFSVRLGFATQSNPINSEVRSGDREVVTRGTITHYGLDYSNLYLTGGLGYRFTPQFYMDAALVGRISSSDIYAFAPMPSVGLISDPADYSAVTLRGLITLGYRF
jgi:long-subunit fatty acid transport protein